MKVFISWSGQRSRAIAEALRDWLPNVIQAVEPWVSVEDIEKGLRWSSEIAVELEQTSFGIICLTPENREAPWIMFEAGALSKFLDKSFVCPFLFGIEPADIEGPLTQFQATKAQKADTKKLVLTVNRALEATKLPDGIVERAFEVWWPHLEQNLSGVPELRDEAKTERPEREIMEEILEIVRSEARESRSFSTTREEFMAVLSELLDAGLRNDRNVEPEVRGAIERLKTTVSPRRSKLKSRTRVHRPEGKVVRARALAQRTGKYRALVSEPKGEDRLTGLVFDCETREIAQTTADSIVQEGYPHSCREEKCGGWSTFSIGGQVFEEQQNE